MSRDSMKSLKISGGQMGHCSDSANFLITFKANNIEARKAGRWSHRPRNNLTG